MLRKLLVANRGEIARRVFRTCREMGIDTVAVFSEADRDAPFAREAAQSVAIGGNSPGESYLRGDAIIDAARRTGADAIHPGYGFLAENAAFATACADAGLIFVGPSPKTIEAMGSKIAAKQLMREADVPTLPDATLEAGSDEEILAAVETVGLPLLVKASAGGGGRGMRIVRTAGEAVDAVAAARREAAGAFGDDTVFLERYVEGGRHVEIQILGDTHGQVVSLFERDCSIQRRHQKVVEESPSPALDDQLRQQMSDAAVNAGKALGYVNAGTVEFLLAPDGAFFFLEVNTRLQVEHPVTELVCGVDLVRAQLIVASGDELPRELSAPKMSGHAIEVRLYAEDAEQQFLPQTGRLTRFAIPDGVRVDTGVESGSEISVHYDPMIAKVIAAAPTRTEAATRLAAALRKSELHGLTTNRDFLVRVLEHPEFLAGSADTAFLERHEPAMLGATLVDPQGELIHVAAAALAGQAERQAATRSLPHVPSGWRNNPSQPQQITFAGARGALAVEYAMGRAGAVSLSVNGEPLGDLRLGECRADLVEIEVSGIRQRLRTRREGATWWVNDDHGQSELTELERFPSAGAEGESGSLVSPMPGIVLRVLVEKGQRVDQGTPLVVVEAMKMEHEIVAPTPGTVSSLPASEGKQVEAGAILAVIDEDQDEPGSS